MNKASQRSALCEILVYKNKTALTGATRRAILLDLFLCLTAVKQRFLSAAADE